MNNLNKQSLVLVKKKAETIISQIILSLQYYILVQVHLYDIFTQNSMIQDISIIHM